MRSKEEIMDFEENQYWGNIHAQRCTLEVLVDIRDILYSRELDEKNEAD